MNRPRRPTPNRPAARLRRAAFALPLLAAGATLSACAQGPGVRPAGVPEQTPVVTAGDRPVWITPPDGFCVDDAAIRPEGAAAFVLIEDCALVRPEDEIADENAVSGLPIPRPALVNGLVTLSIGDGPLFEGPDADREADFAGLERFLRSEAGRASAGMGGAAEVIRIVETRRVDDTLYVLVEDQGEQVVPVLGDRFWRGFTEVNERAVIASLGVFDSSSMRDEAKLAHLARVVAALKNGNGDPVGPAETALAAAAPKPRTARTAMQTPMSRQAPRVETAAPPARPETPPAEIAAPAVDAAPVPTPARAPASRGGEAPAGAEGLAPARAPRAPIRPDALG